MHKSGEQVKRLFDEPGLIRALQENGLEQARADSMCDITKQIERLLTDLNRINCASSIQKF